MPGTHPDAAALERIRLLARDLAASDPGPAADLGSALAAEVARIAGQVDALAGRVDGLWRLISAVVESAGLAGSAGTTGTAGSGGPGDPGDAGSGGPAAPPPEFLRAIASPRRSSDRALRLNLNDREWVAAISQDEPPADPARTWAALERLTRVIGDQDDQGDQGGQGGPGGQGGEGGQGGRGGRGGEGGQGGQEEQPQP